MPCTTTACQKQYLPPHLYVGPTLVVACLLMPVVDNMPELKPPPFSILMVPLTFLLACRALQSEVADAAKLIQKPAELKAAVMHTYQTFVDGNAADRTRDISMEAEFNRCGCQCLGAGLCKGISFSASVMQTMSSCILRYCL